MQANPGTDDILVVQQTLARLQALLEAARQVHSTIRLEEVLSITLDLVLKELEAEGAFLHFLAPGYAGRAPLVTGAVPHDWTQPRNWSGLPGYTSVALPGHGGEPIAQLVAYRPQPLSFEENDFLEGLGLQAATAVANAHHHERTVEWERLQRDLDAARTIQHSLLPQSVPVVPVYSLTFRMTALYLCRDGKGEVA